MESSFPTLVHLFDPFCYGSNSGFGNPAKDFKNFFHLKTFAFTLPRLAEKLLILPAFIDIFVDPPRLCCSICGPCGSSCNEMILVSGPRKNKQWGNSVSSCTDCAADSHQFSPFCRSDGSNLFFPHSTQYVSGYLNSSYSSFVDSVSRFDIII